MSPSVRDDSGVQSGRSGRGDEQRVDLELGDLGVGRGVLAEPGHRPRGGGDVHARAGRGTRRAAAAVRNRISIRVASASSTGASATWTSRNTSVAVPPMPTSDGRAEARIPAGADDQLDTAAQVGHLLDRERRRVELGDQPVVRLDERRAGLQAHHDAAGVGLVQQAERLEDERWSAVRRRPRPVPRPCAPRAPRRTRCRRRERVPRRGVVGGRHRLRGRGHGRTACRRRARSRRTVPRPRPRWRRTPGTEPSRRIRHAGASG